MQVQVQVQVKFVSRSGGGGGSNGRRPPGVVVNGSLVKVAGARNSPLMLLCEGGGATWTAPSGLPRLITLLIIPTGCLHLLLCTTVL